MKKNRYRVGRYQSLILDYVYVVQRKVWWGWKTVASYDEFSKSAAIDFARKLQRAGNSVKWHI